MKRQCVNEVKNLSGFKKKDGTFIWIVRISKAIINANAYFGVDINPHTAGLKPVSNY